MPESEVSNLSLSLRLPLSRVKIMREVKKAEREWEFECIVVTCLYYQAVYTPHASTSTDLRTILP